MAVKMQPPWTKGMKFAAGLKQKGLLLLLATVAIHTCARAQLQQTDPYTNGAATGATGLQPRSGPADTESVSSHADQGKLLQFKSQTTIVQVPVVVTDKGGNHIHGLAKADFKVLENGKPQKIASFEEIIPAAIARPSAIPTAGTFTNVSPDEDKPRALAVILLDEVNTPFFDQAYARKQLVKYLATHLQPSQPVGLMSLSEKGLTTLSGFDTDPQALMAALRKASGHVSTMENYSNDAKAIAATGNTPNSLLRGISASEAPELVIQRFTLQQDALTATYSQARAIETTLGAFLEIAWSLSGTPGRKSLVWVTGSFPFYLDSFTSVPGDNSLRALYERSLQAINDAQISIYPVDARGLLSDETYSGENTGSLLPAGASDSARQSSITSLKTFAAMTGGVAFYNTNDLSGAYGRAVQDSSSYYLLSYYLDHHDNKMGWRKLQVEVSRADTEVRARAGFLVTDVSANPKLTQKADLDLALHSPFESTGIPVTERWEGLRTKGQKKQVGFVLRVPVTGLIDEADKNYVDLEFVAQAMNKGAAAGTVSQQFKGNIPLENLAKLKTDGVLYQNFFELAPGDYEVHFVVRDNLTGRIGSVIVPLTVD
jgi:VWFA-related protein